MWSCWRARPDRRPAVDGRRRWLTDRHGRVVDPHPDRQSAAAFAAQADIACRPGNFVPDLSGYDRHERRRVTDAELAAMIDRVLRRLPRGPAGARPTARPRRRRWRRRPTSSSPNPDSKPSQARRLRAAIKFIFEADATDYLELQPAVAEHGVDRLRGRLPGRPADWRDGMGDGCHGLGRRCAPERPGGRRCGGRRRRGGHHRRRHRLTAART